MNTTIILFGIVVIALIVNTLFLDRTVRYIEEELEICLHDIDDLEAQAKAQADLCKSLVSMITDYDKRLDKFEFAVERTESETNFADGVDAIFSYDAMTALKAAKKERGDA